MGEGWVAFDLSLKAYKTTKQTKLKLYTKNKITA